MSPVPAGHCPDLNSEQLTHLTFLWWSVTHSFAFSANDCWILIRFKVLIFVQIVLPFERISCSCVSVNLWKWANVRESFFVRGGEASRWEGWSRWVGGRGGGEGGNWGGVESSIYNSEIFKSILQQGLQKAGEEYTLLKTNKHKITSKWCKENAKPILERAYTGLPISNHLLPPMGPINKRGRTPNP